jgi:lysophospholipase L1-like esterase
MRVPNSKSYYIILFVFALILVLVSLNSCKPVLSPETRSDREEAGEGIERPEGNNYKGLRVETLDLDPDETAGHDPRIACFGDSVTFGWNIEYENSYPRVLKRLLEGSYSQIGVINSGIGGNTIIDAYSRLDDDVFYFNPHLVIINFGLNDGVLLKTDENGNKNNTNKSLLEERELPSMIDLNTFENTYDDIIQKLRAEGTGVIALGTNPIMDSLFDDSSYFEKQDMVYEEYNRKVEQVAAGNNIVYIDLRDIFRESGQAENLMAGDGFHPNEAGLGLIAESVYQLVKDGSFFKDPTVK